MTLTKRSPARRIKRITRKQKLIESINPELAGFEPGVRSTKPRIRDSSVRHEGAAIQWMRDPP